MWPPLTWMRLDRAVDWAWVRIQGYHNTVLITFEGGLGKLHLFGAVFGPFGALTASWMCSEVSLDVDEIR